MFRHFSAYRPSSDRVTFKRERKDVGGLALQALLLNVLALAFGAPGPEAAASRVTPIVTFWRGLNKYK